MTSTTYIKHKNIKKNKPVSTNKTHPLLYIISLIIIVNKINTTTCSQWMQLNTNTLSTIQTMQKLEYLHMSLMLIVSCTKSIKLKPNQTHKLLIVQMILLSNDVETHPGPPPKILKDYIGSSLQCTTCNRNTLISEEIINLITESNFEWICPTSTCSTNHQLLNYLTSPTISPNRYNSLPDQDSGDNPTFHSRPLNQTPKHEKPNPTNTTCNRKLLNELPKISPKAYIGKDLCRRCFKEVKDQHRAVLCDCCNSWIHLKCSDMTSRIQPQ